MAGCRSLSVACLFPAEKGAGSILTDGDLRLERERNAQAPQVGLGPLGVFGLQTG